MLPCIYISVQQSAQVSGTSGVGPTTFQQDQSAKKKPKKSNNENEVDVSTIPQKSDESMYLYTEFPNFDLLEFYNIY